MVSNYDVIVIAHVFYPHVGGIETSAKNLLEYLTDIKKLKCAIFFCSPETKSYKLNNFDCFSQKTIIILKGLYPIATIQYSARLFKYLKNNPNAKVFIFGRHLSTSVIGTLLCKILGRKYIYIDSGFQPNIFSSSVLNQVMNLLDKYVFVNVVKWAKHRIIISEYTFNIFKKQFPKIKDNISIINNGFSEEIISKYSINNKLKQVVWASRISEIKDPLTVANAYKQIANNYKDWQFYLIGKGDFEINKDEFKDFTNITIIPNLLPQSELWELLSKTAIYINSSISEGMSVAVLEAAALGCLPVLSDADSNIEVANKLTSTYIFKKKDSADLAIVLIKAINDFSEQAAQKVSGKAYENFSSTVIFEQYYKRLMEIS